jgi:triacylglycerol esterase/lipase EstA (alpha/beta hydrolase family)
MDDATAPLTILAWEFSMKVRTPSHRRTAWPLGCALVGALAAGLVTAPATVASADAISEPDGGIGNFPVALLASVWNPDAPPPGANRWDCRPSAAHPRPVVLVHGTWENAFDIWNAMSPALVRAGYCVFAAELGEPWPHAVFKGTDDIDRSAAQLAAFVDRVRTATGAAQVDLVGHSQGGGPLARQYLRFHGGANAADPERNKVHTLVGIDPSNHGTALGRPLGAVGRVADPPLRGVIQINPAVEEQAEASAVNQRLDAGGDTMPGVHYTVLATMADEVLVPYTNSFLTPGPGATVSNITLQKVCPVDLADHLAAPYDELVITLTENALDPAHPTTPLCRPAVPVVGTLPGVV